MFETALQKASAFTFPYVGLRHKHDGTVFSIVGAFVVVNADGWAITAAHLMRDIVKAKQSAASAKAVDKRIAELRSAHGHMTKEAIAEAAKLENDKRDFLSHSAEIWALPGFADTHPAIVEHHIHEHADVAAFLLQPFDPARIGQPVFRDGHDSVLPGTAVCRVGFPWHQVDATFDGDSGFNVRGGFPVPTFAIDGMVSRFHAEQYPDGSTCTSIETSSPGLRGQSGGPLLDTEGRVCGLQSGTAHYDLGFDATYVRDGEQVVERQFLNVGRAVHVDDIKAFLGSIDVAYSVG